MAHYKKIPGRREYLRLATFSLLIAIFNMILFKAVNGWDAPTPWMAVSFSFEVILAFGLYSLQGTIRSVLWIQFLLGFTLRMINTLKIRLLGTPILPSDFFLIEEVYRVTPGWMFGLGALAVATPLAISLYLFFRFLSRPTLIKSALALPALLLTVLVVGFSELYTGTFDKILENELYGIPFLMKERQHAMGVPLSFSLDLARFLIAVEAEPSEENVRDALTRLGQSGASSPVARAPAGLLRPRNVYIFMVESFWDPKWLLNVPDGLDPNFREIWHANGGLHMLSPMLGGGTANVEFEVLCGIPSRTISKGIIFQVALANEVPCLPKILANEGYRTFAFHAFESGYFNRNAAFPSLGFEKFEGVEDLLVDSDAGVFVADQDFIVEAMRRAREYSEGKPFLAYFMTFAGHWPYAWLPDIYTKEISVREAVTDEKMNMLERHLNINRISSTVMFKTIQALQLEDPDALIVVAGDHMPALGISGKDPDANDWRFYHTPLMIVDRFNDTSNLGAFVPSYGLASEILSRVGVSDDKQGFVARLRAPAGLVIRPEQNNATFIAPTGSRDFKICTPAEKDPVCQIGIQWLNDVRVISRDMVTGEQYTLGF